MTPTLRVERNPPARLRLGVNKATEGQCQLWARIMAGASAAGQHASTTILAPAAACRRTRILAGHSQRAGNATAATCTRRFLQVSARPVLSVYPQSHLQFTCNSKSSKCNIKLYNMIKCSAKSLVPTWHTLLGMRRIQTNFFERQLWPVLVTCTLLARYLPLLAVARRCSCSYPQGSMACE